MASSHAFNRPLVLVVVSFLLLFLLASCYDTDLTDPGRQLHSNHDDSLAAATSNGLCALVVNPQGYQCQEFEVITEDGYILTMHRIPQGRGGGDHLERRQPVLLQHGLLVDGMQWILNSPQQSLAFVLADSGFDVWISHIRGTRWSRRHVSLDPSSAAYWSWSWDELAAYELPATVGLVFNQTGQKLHYVGHSMGTLIALSSLSEGKLVDKLKSAALLSPVAYLSHMETPLGILAAKTFTGEASFCHSKTITAWPCQKLLDPFCRLPGANCFDYMTSITGINCCLNASSVELFLQYEPQPTSLKTMIHFAQTYRDGVIRKYDYQSSAVNMVQYGESEPPAYNMANIPQDFPLFLSYGGEDLLSDVKDVTLLLDDLKHHDQDKLTVQFVKDYAHADFVIGVNAKTVVYDGMIAFFRRH
ncbi:triacylglycerol lipase 2-like [Canna indica]|uniref:Lipase n=1 Tax=Canna indica TaxID=4628 RepID=A0AAQ3JUZ2_9LILI|nr:triacylglycerol lipase 2-like [Canna indica]